MTSWKEKFTTIFTTVILCLFIAQCTRWEWNECRKVGHGALYCLVKMGH